MAFEEAPPLLRPKALCELCGSHASVFCPSDDAHLCVTCDAKVHSANFLVSRHCRVLLCFQCRGPTPVRLWGPSPAIPQALCPFCCDNFHLTEKFEPCFPAMWQNNGAGFDEIANQARVQGEILGGEVLRGGEEESEVESEGECLREGGYLEEEEGCSASPVSVLSSEDCSVPSQDHNGDFSAETQSESEQSDCHGGRESVHCVTSLLQEYPRLSISETQKRNSKTIVNCGQKRKRDNEGCDIEDGQKRSRDNEVGDKDTCSSSSFSAESPDPIPGGLSEQAAARLKRVLSSWQVELGLSEVGGIELAMKFLQKALKRLQPKMRMLGADTLRITLATCLWLSLKLGTEQAGVPKASQVAEVTGVSANRLRSMELQLLVLLDWRPLEGCLDKETV